MLAQRFVLLAVLLVALVGCSGTSARQEPGPVTLAAVGDVLLARGVGEQIAEHGPDYPFSKTRGIIKSADVAFINLECPLSKRGVPQRDRFLFRSDPSLAHTLAGNGFNVACLANNHTLDYGRTAMLDTAESVEQAGMTALGAGKNLDEASKVRVMEKKGLRVGFLAFSDLPSPGVVRLADKPTVAVVDDDRLPEQVRQAKRSCDVLVVSFHWGIEYMKRPTERQQMLAHLCIDSGADLILGHHPHVLQPTETYKGRPIIYSMGGFVWDSKLFGADKSAVYVIELKPRFARVVKIIPLHVRNCCPSPEMPK